MGMRIRGLKTAFTPRKNGGLPLRTTTANKLSESLYIAKTSRGWPGARWCWLQCPLSRFFGLPRPRLTPALAKAPSRNDGFEASLRFSCASVLEQLAIA